MQELGNIFYFKWELDFLHWIQSIRTPALDAIVPKITSLGDSGLLWIIVILVFLILPYNRKIGVQGTISLILTVIVCNVILKPLVMRCRPCWLEPDVQLLVKNPHDFSFPSGHSNASFAVATAVFTRNKKVGIPLLVLAASIALSRMYVFVHWPTDVIGGTLIGITGGIVSYYIVNYIYNRFNKSHV